MTTVAPIDLERDRLECVALVDLENIRLSWQRTYLRVFEYADLVLLCHLTERLMDTNMSRIVIFATDPKQYHAQQIKAVAVREQLLSTPAHTQISDREVQILTRALKERGVKLPDDIAAGYRLIHQLEHDVTPGTTKSQVVGLNVPTTTISAQKLAPIQIQFDPSRNHSTRKRARTDMLVSSVNENRAGRPSESGASKDDDSSSSTNTSKNAAEVTNNNDASSLSSNSLEELSSTSDDDDDNDDDDVSSDVEVIGSEGSHSPQLSGSDSEDVEVVKEVWHPVTSGQTRSSVRAHVNGVKQNLNSSKSDSEGISVPLLYGDGGMDCVRCSGATSDGNNLALGGLNSRCKVELRLYGYKSQKGRVVQRGCDVALGAEITKACFHPNVDKICLFSADSDFQELMHQNLEAEDIGGVVKYAKTSWVCGFRQAFTSDRVSGLQLRRRRPYLGGNSRRGGSSSSSVSQPENAIISHGNINYVLLDEVFPQIRKMLEQKNIYRHPWNPAPLSHKLSHDVTSNATTNNLRHVKRSRGTHSFVNFNKSNLSIPSTHIPSHHKNGLPPTMPTPQLPPVISP